MSKIDVAPSKGKVKRAPAGLKINKAPGPDELPAELFEYGDEAVIVCFVLLITTVWNSGCISQRWKYTSIVNIYKKSATEHYATAVHNLVFKIFE